MANARRTIKRIKVRKHLQDDNNTNCLGKESKLVNTFWHRMKAGLKV